MAPFSGLLSAVSKAIPLVGSDTNVTDAETQEPLLTDSDLAGCLGEDESTRKTSMQSSGAHRSVLQSTRDTKLRARLETDTTASMGLSSPGSHLRPPRPKSQRSSSDSHIESSSFAKGTVGPETMRQRQIMAGMSNLQRSNMLHRSKSRSRGGTGNPAVRSNRSMNVLSSARSISNPGLQMTLGATSRPDVIKPLKTCLKQRAKSANTTPPNEATTSVMSPVKNQNLRRVKTVDFEKAISESAPPPQDAPVSTSDHRQARGRRVPQRLDSCPGAALLARRSPACPAVTRTDVHVIAIAPSSSSPTGLFTADEKEFRDTDRPTPTMQIVESGNGRYEVVWDDVPPEHSVRIRRRSSSASQALGAASAGTRGLERVNTKLTEWSGTWNTPSNSFRPTVVVFPDDGRGPHFECAIVDDEDINISVPPNSERVSAVHSRCPSRPPSARISRSASHDESRDPVTTQDIPIEDQNTPLELVVPDPEAWSAHLVAARRKLAVPSPERKLLNVGKADSKFRNHRDSLTLAHGRLLDSGEVRPELFAHKDSVKIAKKRMYAKNHKHAQRLESKSESEKYTDDNAAMLPPLPVVKAHAAEALTHAAPVPILRHTRSASGSHIRIKGSLSWCT